MRSRVGVEDNGVVRHLEGLVEGVVTLVEVSRRPNYDEWEYCQRLVSLYTQAKQAKGNLLIEWKRNYRLTMNRTSSALPAAAGVRANEVFPTIDSRIGWMTDQEITCAVTPASDPFSAYFATETILGEQLECVINSVYQTDQWYAEVVKMLWDSAMYGAGFMKAVWDQGLLAGYGNVALRRVSPWCLYVDPFASNLTDAEYIVEVHMMTPSEIERRYPQVSERLIADAMLAGDVSKDSLPPSQDTSNPDSGYKLIPVNAGQGATTWGPPGGAVQPGSDVPYRAINVYETWVKENYVEDIEPADPTKPTEQVVVSEWRVIVHAGGRILLDEMASNLFHTNRHPYVRYVDVETGDLWGSALVRDIGPCQVALNRLLALAQNNIEYTGNPIFVGVKGSGMDRSTFINRPGRIYDVDGGPQSQSKKPEWLQPPNLPQALFQFMTFWRDEIERIAGIQGGQRGEIPSGRATDKQVSATQEAGFIRVRSAQRNLEMCLRKCFELIANLVVINYDVPRTVAIVGPEGEVNSLRLSANHFYTPAGKTGPEPLRFSLLVHAGSDKPTSRAARIQEANALHQMQVVDDQYVLQAYRVSHWQAVYQRTQQQKQQAAMIAALQGGPKGQARGPGTGHEH